MQLFKKRDLNGSGTSSFLDGLGLPKISEIDRLMCEEEVTLEDLKEAMLSMSDDKSPGNDGITKEFYNHFWDEVDVLYFEGLMSSKQKK